MGDIITHLRIVLLSGTAAIVLGVICLIIFFLFAGASRFAWGALITTIASAGALAAALAFDLRGSKDITTITTEYTFDRAVPQLRQWLYARSLGNRYATEVLANYEVLRRNPAIFGGDRDELTRKMILFSIIAYLEMNQSDWQMEFERYTTSLGSMTTWKPSSNPASSAECTKVSMDDIQRMLKDVGNEFADARPAFAPVNYLCLPPWSSIGIDRASIQLMTPFYTISFVIEPVTMQFTMMKPGSHTLEIPTLPNGNPRFETRVIGVRVIRKLSWLMAQHREVDKYEKWSQGIVDGLRAWFETKTTDGPGPPWFGDDGEGEGAMFWTGFQLGGTETRRQVWVQGSKVFDHQPP
jgi:hypothetical protein